MALWPVLVYGSIVVLLVVAMIGLSYVLGQRHSDPATRDPYESGIVSEGSAHMRFPADFYLVAVFFVIFDLEAVFLFAWAVVGRALGWKGYAEVVVFTAILILTLAYLVGVGALDWGGPRGRRRQEGHA